MSDFSVSGFRKKQGPRADKGQRHTYPGQRRARQVTRKDAGAKHHYPKIRKKVKFSFLCKP